MNNNFKFSPMEDDRKVGEALIKIVGVGGGGENAVNRMLEDGLGGAQYYAINTDRQALANSVVPESNKLCIGPRATNGLGAGADPQVGKKAAEESHDEIRKIIAGADMVFVTAGMGGGTGTGAAPIVAAIAKELGVLTIGVVTKPFRFEGKKRTTLALEGIGELEKYCDTLICIPNDNLIKLSTEKKNMTMLDSFKQADGMLRQSVQGITSLITNSGVINLDFADVTRVIKNKGTAYVGIGEAKGENMVVNAVNQALTSPLFEHSIQGSEGMLINFTGGPDLSLNDVTEGMEIISEYAHPDADIIFGTTVDESVEGVKVTIIATGFKKQEQPVEKPQREFGLGFKTNDNAVRRDASYAEIPSFFRKSSSI